ncbi:MAG TPA: hypothetical protein VGE07_27550 [Herpetosiphonaceae bacterium]
MEREPGFGHHPAWYGQAMVGIGALLFALLSLPIRRWDALVGFLTIAIGCGIWAAILIQRAKTDDAQVWAAPPHPTADLTRRVLQWTRAAHADLVPNRRGTLSAKQRARHQLEDVPVYYAEGAVRLTCTWLHKRRSAKRYLVTIDGVTFTSRDARFTAVFKRTATYRLYFVHLPHRYRALSRLELVAGEALADAVEDPCAAQSSAGDGG